MEDPVDRAVVDDVLLACPVADGKTRQIRRAHGGRLHAGRPLDRRAGDIGLHLHQQVVGRSAAVDVQCGQFDAGVRLHGDEDVVDLIGQGFHRRADDVVLVDAAGDAHDGAARVLIPVRRAEARERRDDVAAVGILDLAGIVFRIRRGLDDLQLVAQPLDGGAGDEDGAFERVFDLAVQAPGDRGDQTILGEHGLLTGVHQQERAGAVGVLSLAGMVAGLAEEGGLLVAGRARDLDRAAEQRRIGLAVDAARGHRSREHAAGDIELLEDVVVPLQGVDVEEHGTRGVGVVGHVDLAARQLPDEPRLDRAEQQLAALRTLTRAGDVFEQPVDLRAGEIGVDDEASLGAEGIGQALGLERVAVFARPAALPDDGVVDRLAGDLIPDDRGLALVGDADGGDVGGSRADLLHGLDSDT